MLFGINSTSYLIEIVRGEYFNCFTSAIDPRLPVLSLANTRPAFKKSFAIVAIISFTHYLLPLELSFQRGAPPNLL